MGKAFDPCVGLSLDLDGLYSVQANRPPFLLMKEAFGVVENVQAASRFTFAADWYLFGCHFAKEPLVPATIIFEMMMQTAALAPLLGRNNDHKTGLAKDRGLGLVYLVGINKSKIMRKVVPESSVVTKTVISWRKGAFGIARADVSMADSLAPVAQANLTFSCSWL